MPQREPLQRTAPAAGIHAGTATCPRHGGQILKLSGGPAHLHGSVKYCPIGKQYYRINSLMYAPLERIAAAQRASGDWGPALKFPKGL